MHVAGNPVLTAKDRGRSSPLQAFGHADLVQMPDGEWRAVAAIPLKAVGIAPEQNNKVPMLFYRLHPARSPKEHARHTSWGGGKVHSPDGFGDLVFQLE